MPDRTVSVLIVDDEDEIRTALSHELMEIGYAVRIANNGFSALFELGELAPDILISDLNMPGLSGVELLSVVRRRFPAVRVIAMSGAFTGSEVPSGVAADAFYEKGSSIRALLQIIGTLSPTKACPPPPLALRFRAKSSNLKTLEPDFHFKHAVSIGDPSSGRRSP